MLFELKCNSAIAGAVIFIAVKLCMDLVMVFMVSRKWFPYNVHVFKGLAASIFQQTRLICGFRPFEIGDVYI